jgi:hypothetical protein
MSEKKKKTETTFAVPVADTAYIELADRIVQVEEDIKYLSCAVGLLGLIILIYIRSE